MIVGKRALLPCYISLQDAKHNGIGSFKVIITAMRDNEHTSFLARLGHLDEAE